MNTTRVFEEGNESTMINMITEIVGEEFWNKALVVLVQANLFIHKLRDQEDNEDRVRKVYKDNFN